MGNSYGNHRRPTADHVYPLVSSGPATGITASPTFQYQATSSASSEGSASKPSVTGSGSGISRVRDASFAEAILDAQNSHRVLHGVATLSWDNSTYAYAQSNAGSYDCSGVLTHTHGPNGENLAAGFADGPSAGQTNNYQTNGEYNHFTQVIWKGTTSVGCAYKDCQAQGWGKYVVCEYSPPGNVVGQLSGNVLPLI
ncbi:PR-1-like protein [Metschnikowia bicuspidata]|uniref:PR-1-like protein n=1 Tax=Metschnikowia bicuspidata TaxID=27322 RepID=A0A4P9ZEP8_9ASCO|nr:PR-1-like protein [Metschnikowia bicuspidata]